MQPRRGPHLALLLLLAGCAASPALRPDFADAAALTALECTDPAAFELATVDGRACLALARASHYQPRFRSPLAMALLRPTFADCTLDVTVRQTSREYPHRDLILVFAWHDAEHFAYAHLASQADANAHHVMLVDGADRRPVTTFRTDGVAWGDGWHRLRLQRHGDAVAVFFDDLERPVLRGVVPAGAGRVGVGSFDDTGLFTALEVRSGAPR